MIKERKFKDIRVGEKASLSKTFTEKDVRAFAEITGDFNPIHLNKEFAKNSIFGERVVHGILTVGLISNVLGNVLPGPNTIYLSQEAKFLAPVKFGDTLTAECEVIEKRDEKKILLMKTTVKNQDGAVVVDGTAKVLKR
jgi:3-hydroxybutyryl-CoA dehydratase